MISLIVAKSKNNVIGNKGRIPWYIPNDLKRFKKLTTDKVVIMGRKTFDSLPEEYKPLPNRINIILSKDESYQPSCCMVLNDLKKALRKAGSDKEVFIIGGGEIYKAALPYTDILDLTLIDDDKPADVFFPEYPEFKRTTSLQKNWQI